MTNPVSSPRDEAADLELQLIASPTALVKAGITLVATTGALAARQRVWAALARSILSAATAAGTGAWVIAATFACLISPVNFLRPLAIAVAIFAGLAIGACRRRERLLGELAATGLNVDF